MNCLFSFFFLSFFFPVISLTEAGAEGRRMFQLFSVICSHFVCFLCIFAIHLTLLIVDKEKNESRKTNLVSNSNNNHFSPKKKGGKIRRTSVRSVPLRESFNLGKRLDLKITINIMRKMFRVR